MNIKLGIASSIAALAVAGTATAGSFEPAPAQPVVAQPVAVVAPSNDWTGFYAGGSLGYSSIKDGAEEGTAYGLHAGYDYDMGNFVVGGEAEYLGRWIWSNGAADSARLKARAGVDLGNTLVYGVGGLTVVDAQSGYGVGLGVEHRLTDNYSVGAEYMYEQISDFDNNGSDFTANTLVARTSFRF